MTTQQILQGVHDWTNGKIVYDISVAHPDGQGNPTPYTNLAAALGTGGGNIPKGLRKGGMSIKFIQGTVQSSDNKYVQYMYVGKSTAVVDFVNVDNWEKVNLEEEVNQLEREQLKLEDTFGDNIQDSFNVCDSNGNVVAKIDSNGVKAIEFIMKNGETLTSLLNGKVDKVSGKGLSTNDYTNDDKNAISALKMEDEEFYITDLDGNVVAKIGGRGIDSLNIRTLYQDKLYICDKEGNVIFKADKNGISSINFNVEIDTANIKNNAVTTPKLANNAVTRSKMAELSGYNLYSLGDSFSVRGVWQNRIANKVGCNFDSAANKDNEHPLSVGGMSSYGTQFFCMPWRAKNLFLQDVIHDDGESAIIVLQNANDAWNTQTFDPTAKAYIMGDIMNDDTIYIPTQQGVPSEQKFSNTLLSNIPSADRKINGVFRLSRIVNGTNLAINTLPTSEGNVLLGVGGDNTFNYYSIHVVPQATEAATLQYVLDKILEIDYVGYYDTLADDGESIDFAEAGSGSLTPRITFTDTDNTGMTISTSETSNAKNALAWYFKGTDLTDAQWADVSNWQQGLTFSEGMKSGIEFLIRTFPKAHIFLTMFPVHKDYYSNYLTANGTYDHQAFNASDQEVRDVALMTAYKAIAEYYDIPFINLQKECGITLENMSEYIYENNVHPKDAGYYRVADILAEAIKRYL